jgi:hypothetical protein
MKKRNEDKIEEANSDMPEPDHAKRPDAKPDTPKPAGPGASGSQNGRG